MKFNLNILLLVQKKTRCIYLNSSFCICFVSTILLSALNSSCVDYKKLTYFKDIADTTSSTIIDLPGYQSPVIKVDDLIFISIQTIDPSSSQILNSGNIGSSNISSSTSNGLNYSSGSGYLVDENGEVDLPIIGKIKLIGLSTAQARALIKSKSALFFNDPIVNVRFSNFRITVLGEVNKPSAYVVPNEKITVMDAIGMAGDLTVYGRRENVLLIREDNGRKQMVRLNLNSKTIFASPYFYLRPGDIIYIEPNKSRVVSSDAFQVKYITIATSALSLIVLLFTRVIK